MSIKIKNMCDRCLRVLGDDEPMFGFIVYDDDGTERAFKGHEGCIQEIQEILVQLYGVQEEEKNEEA